TWSREQSLSYVNVQSYVEQTRVGSTNTVVNSLDSLGNVVGVESDGSNLRHNALTTDIPVASSESRAWDSLKVLSNTYYVGSISSDITNDNGNYFSSKAAIWSSADTNPVVSPWGNDVNQKRGDYIAQGSMRALA
ncbi:GlyGly-CTERM sorting domain-containing protein, partial [Vibrio sp. 10N.286.51.F4]